MSSKAAASVSVITLARGRQEHLANTVSGFARQGEQPVELVIAAMQPAPFDRLPDTTFPIRQLLVSGDALPLAAARNAAARAAIGDVLVFVDVDCIPTPTLCEDYRRATNLLDAC